MRAALDDPTASLDSQPRLLRSLHRAGLLVNSTSRWELAEHDHPAVAPLIAYKKLMRLYTANGWAWLQEWVHDDRFRPVYVPAGVVTGRWASSGGGALQIPRALRTAVRADPGWTLVTADVAQLEPRVLAAMARDTALAEAASGRDLYAGIVERGAVASRAEAKLAMLGAMYGATTGESGRLLPRLRRTFPRAMRLVDDAARVGEDGEWCARGSAEPPPPRERPGSTFSRARATPRHPESTRTAPAARHAIGAGSPATSSCRARPPSGPSRGSPICARVSPLFRPWMPPTRRPRRVRCSRGCRTWRFFLHDEIVVHTPLAHADAVADAVRASAASAGRLLFGTFPIDFPLDLRIGETAEKG